MTLLDDAAILAAHTGVSLRETYVWLYKHNYTLERVKLYEPLDIATCIDNDWPLYKLRMINPINQEAVKLVTEAMDMNPIKGGDFNADS